MLFLLEAVAVICGCYIFIDIEIGIRRQHICQWEEKVGRKRKGSPVCVVCGGW